MDQHPKDYYARRKAELALERESFMAHWKELAEVIKPRRGRWFIQDRNRGNKRHQAIINSKATDAHKVCVAGMLAGTMSAVRPWFSLETHDPDMMENQSVKEYLFKVERLLRSILNDGNFYGTVSQLISELILFGTACMTHVDDFEDVARFYCHTAGSYMIGTNARCNVDTLFREFEMPAVSIVEKFSYKNASKYVQDAVDKGNYGAWYPVCHMIEPNRDYIPEGPKYNTNMPFSSVYYEPGNQVQDRDKWLLKSGFQEFPVYAPRWDTTGEDIYGTDCPAMTALGDIKMLQVEEKRKAQAIDKMVNPPLSGPPSLRNSMVDGLPGGLTTYDSEGGKQKLEPIYTVNPQLQDLRADIDAVERRIDRAFYVDLFLAISTMEGIQPRNQLDLIQRNEERLLQLGPVLERLQGDLLDPLIDRLFAQANRAGILPPAPDALKGQPLRVKYISTLAMAQRAVATQGIDRMVGFVSAMVGAGFQEALDKFDASQAVDEYARAVGVPPSLIVPDDVVAARRQQAAQQQEMSSALAVGQAGANIAKMAADAKLQDGSSLLDQVGK